MNARSRPSSPLKERVREAVRQAIIDAVEEVASERGVEHASIAAIAERAGVAVGTLYNHFEDRDEIFAAWLGSRRAQLVPRIKAAARTHARLDPEPRLRRLLHDVLTLFDEHRRFIRLLATVDYPALSKRVRQPGVLETLLEALRDILATVDPERAERHAHMIVGAVRAIAQLHSQRDSSMTTDADVIADVFWHGLGPV